MIVRLRQIAVLPPTPPLPAPLTEDQERVRDLVERIAADCAIIQVGDVAKLAGWDLRYLQRRFRDLVGVSPKWVIRRFRLHEAAEPLKSRDAPSLASLAAELGYADQARFSRDFKASVGCTARQFMQRHRGPT